MTVFRRTKKTDYSNLDSIMYVLTVEDMQTVAYEKFGRKLSNSELEALEKPLSNGMGAVWSETVWCALDELEIEDEREECEGCGTKEELYNGYCEDCTELAELDHDPDYYCAHCGSLESPSQMLNGLCVDCSKIKDSNNV